MEPRNVDPYETPQYIDLLESLRNLAETKAVYDSETYFSEVISEGRIVTRSERVRLRIAKLGLENTNWLHYWTADLLATSSVFEELYERLGPISASDIWDLQLADVFTSVLEKLDIDGCGRIQKYGLLLAEKMLHPFNVAARAVLYDYYGRLLVLSQRFDEACVLLRKAFDVYPEQTTGFQSCGQLLLFCGAFSQIQGTPQTLEQNCVRIRMRLVGHHKGVLRKLARAFRTADSFTCTKAFKLGRDNIEPSLHVLFLKWITYLEGIRHGEEVNAYDFVELSDCEKRRLRRTDMKTQFPIMRPHAEHLLLSAYALEMERCWEDSRHDKLDEIYENAWALRGTTSSAFARGVVYEFRARRLLLIPRISRARKLLKDAAEAYELCKSHRRHLCTHLDNMCG